MVYNSEGYRRMYEDEVEDILVQAQERWQIALDDMIADYDCTICDLEDRVSELEQALEDIHDIIHDVDIYGEDETDAILDIVNRMIEK